jgi:hypothetical protein
MLAVRAGIAAAVRAQHFGELVDHERDGEACHEARDDGVRHETRDVAEAQHAEHDLDDAGQRNAQRRQEQDLGDAVGRGALELRIACEAQG